MLHKLRTADAPRFGPLEVARPRIAEEPDVRLGAVHEFGSGWLFRAEGAAPAGIYVESGAGDRRMLLPDTKGHLMLGAMPAGRWVAGLAARQGSAPGRPDAVVFVDPEGGVPEGLSGQALAVSGDGKVGLVADLEAGRLVRLDLETLTGEDVAPLVFDSQEQPVPTLSLDEGGQRAAVMQVEAGRVSLVEVDLERGDRTPIIEGLPEPSWVLGAHVRAEGLIALEMVHDAAARFRVLRFDVGRPAQVLLTLGHGQPARRPVRIKPGWLALVLSLEPHRFTEYGPTDLVALPTGGGARVQITDAGDVRGQPRIADGRLRVEGADAVLRLDLR